MEKFSFLCELSDNYARGQIDFLESSRKTIKEYDEFYDKYIEPKTRQGELSPELEADVDIVVCAQQQQSFKDGFKACMHMMLELMSK